VETADGLMEAMRDLYRHAPRPSTSSRPSDSLRKPMEKVTYSACCHVMFGLEEHLLPETGTLWAAAQRRTSMGRVRR